LPRNELHCQRHARASHCGVQKASSLSDNDPTRLVGLGRAYALAGRKSEARIVLDQLSQFSSRSYVPPYFLATIYAALGENDEAFTWLKEALRERDVYLAWLKVDTAVDPLRRDRRFQSCYTTLGCQISLVPI